ncbi:MAG: hypothetical protein AB1568_17100 [Thermodesulfobacteriota bacterium]
MLPAHRVLLVFLLAAALLGGCSTIDRRAADLLAADYHTMNDAELRGYYQKLNDQLGRESNAARRTTGLIRQQGKEETIAGLRQRWNEVREELGRRGKRD